MKFYKLFLPGEDGLPHFNHDMADVIAYPDRVYAVPDSNREIRCASYGIHTSRDLRDLFQTFPVENYGEIGPLYIAEVEPIGRTHYHSYALQAHGAIRILQIALVFGEIFRAWFAEHEKGAYLDTFLVSAVTGNMAAIVVLERFLREVHHWEI